MQRQTYYQPQRRSSERVGESTQINESEAELRKFLGHITDVQDESDQIVEDIALVLEEVE